MKVPLYSRFIGGTTIRQAIQRSACQTWVPIFDLVKEGIKTDKEATMYKDKVVYDLKRIGMYGVNDAFMALKVSSFLNEKKRDAGCIESAIDSITDVAKIARMNGIQVLIDAESHKWTKVEDAVIDGLYDRGLEVYKTYQMYRSDGMKRLIEDLIDGKIRKYKIVRGAYMKEDRLGGVLLKDKSEVDAAYNLAIRAVHGVKKNRLIIATHNSESIYIASRYVDMDRVCFAQLLGMSDDLTEKIGVMGFKTAKYVPYGGLWESIPYLGRRLIENWPILEHAIRR